MNLSDIAKDIVAESQNILNDFQIHQFSPTLDYVDIFPQTTLERLRFIGAIPKLGDVVFETMTGQTYKLNVPINTVAGPLELLRIRIFDKKLLPFRGYSDYAVSDFKGAKELLLKKKDVKLIEREGCETIEIWSKKYPVLLYIPSVPLSLDLMPDK